MQSKRPLHSIADAFQAILEVTPQLKAWKISHQERTYRLERMRLLLARFENPHLAYKTIHIAGSKGKGSTSVFLASALRAAGYQAGLYTSPHVSDPGERISVNCALGEKPVIDELLTQLMDVSASFPEFELPGAFPWTAFELITAFAFLYFRATKCQFAVIETGIGGRWDATNVVQPIVSVLTPLDLEHTDVLGETYEEIAREKSGIIKPDVPVFSAVQRPEVQAIFRSESLARHAPIRFLDEELETLATTTHLTGTTVKVHLKGRRRQQFRLKMLGNFQAENAALAYLTLRSVLPRLSCQSIVRGFEQAFLPGRLELVQTTPPVMLDGAHTALAARRLWETFGTLFSEPGILIFGAIAGKKVTEMAEILVPHFEQIIISTPGHFKESHPEHVTAIFQTRHPRVMLEKDPQHALQRALQASQGRLPILVTGSLYMVAEIRKHFF